MSEKVIMQTQYDSPLVKICGITNYADAQRAVELGAESLGFNFFSGSLRFIQPEVAAEIIVQLPKETSRVGVFVNETFERIVETIEMTGINIVQLHGDEGVSMVAQLRALPSVEVIKVIRVKPGDKADSLPSFCADALLLDCYSDRGWGGLGKKIDWQLAYEIGLLRGPIFLAGGLNPENVAKAIRMVRPYAVDIASGVESSPGKKDPKKLEAFIRNAKNA